MTTTITERVSAAVAAGHPREAIEILTRERPPVSAELVIVAAEAWAASGAERRAAALLSLAAKTLPDDRRIAVEAARALLRRGQHRRASRVLGRHAASAPLLAAVADRRPPPADAPDAESDDAIDRALALATPTAGLLALLERVPASARLRIAVAARHVAEGHRAEARAILRAGLKGREDARIELALGFIAVDDGAWDEAAMVIARARARAKHLSRDPALGVLVALVTVAAGRRADALSLLHGAAPRSVAIGALNALLRGTSDAATAPAAATVAGLPPPTSPPIAMPPPVAVPAMPRVAMPSMPPVAAPSMPPVAMPSMPPVPRPSMPPVPVQAPPPVARPSMPAAAPAVPVTASPSRPTAPPASAPPVEAPVAAPLVAAPVTAPVPPPPVEPPPTPPMTPIVEASTPPPVSPDAAPPASPLSRPVVETVATPPQRPAPGETNAPSPPVEAPVEAPATPSPLAAPVEAVAPQSLAAAPAVDGAPAIITSAVAPTTPPSSAAEAPAIDGAPAITTEVVEAPSASPASDNTPQAARSAPPTWRRPNERPVEEPRGSPFVSVGVAVAALLLVGVIVGPKLLRSGPADGQDPPPAVVDAGVLDGGPTAFSNRLGQCGFKVEPWVDVGVTTSAWGIAAARGRWEGRPANLARLATPIDPAVQSGARMYSARTGGRIEPHAVTSLEGDRVFGFAVLATPADRPTVREVVGPLAFDVATGRECPMGGGDRVCVVGTARCEGLVVRVQGLCPVGSADAAALPSCALDLAVATDPAVTSAVAP